MKTILAFIRKLALQLLGLFPTRLPVGVTEFQAWVDRFIATYTLPSRSRDDVAFAVSSMIMHFGPTEARKPLYFFYRALHAGAAKQIAGYHFQEIKLRQQAAAQAAQLAAQQAAIAANQSTAEVTANPVSSATP